MAQTTQIAGNRFFPKFSDGQLWAGPYNRAGAWVTRSVTINDADPSGASAGFEFWGNGLRVRLHSFSGGGGSGMTSADLHVWTYAGYSPTWAKLYYYDSGLTKRTYSFTSLTGFDIIIPQEHIVGTQRVFLQVTNTSSPGSVALDHVIL